MDMEVKRTTRKIFNNLKHKQPKIDSRKSDRAGLKKLIRDYHELDPDILSKE